MSRVGVGAFAGVRCMAFLPAGLAVETHSASGGEECSSAGMVGLAFAGRSLIGGGDGLPGVGELPTGSGVAVAFDGGEVAARAFGGGGFMVLAGECALGGGGTSGRADSQDLGASVLTAVGSAGGAFPRHITN